MGVVEGVAGRLDVDRKGVCVWFVVLANGGS